MKELLAKIMDPPPTATSAATVQRRLSPGRYELRDDLGRTLQADAEAFYSPGAVVLVQSGRIVGRVGGDQTIIKTYEV